MSTLNKEGEIKLERIKDKLSLQWINTKYPVYCMICEDVIAYSDTDHTKDDIFRTYICLHCRRLNNLVSKINHEREKK